MQRKSGAIGFAVYIDRLERLEPVRNKYDVDTVLLYDEAASPVSVMKYAQQLREAGVSVLVQKRKEDTIRCRQLIKMQNGEVEIFENDT